MLRVTPLVCFMISPTSSSSFLGVGSVLVVGSPGGAANDLIEALSSDGFEVAQAMAGYGALELLRAEWQDALLVDDDLPDLPPAALCRLVRHEPEISRIPIIVIGTQPRPTEVVPVLRAGADEYLSIDDGVPVVLARLKSVLRRCSWGRAGTSKATARDDDQVIRIGQIQIRPARFEALVNGRRVDLTVSEFRILHLLAGRPNHVFRRDQVFQALHAGDTEATERSLDSHVYSLRRKLTPCESYIQTVRGVGYRIVNDAPR